MFGLFNKKKDNSSSNSFLRLKELEKELQGLSEQCEKISQRQAEIRNEISAIKIDLYKASEVCENITEEVNLMVEMQQTTIEPENHENSFPQQIIIPNPLKIKGYERFDRILLRYYDELFNYNFYSPKTDIFHYYAGYFIPLSVLALSRVGKEIIAVKTAMPNDKSIKETKDIIETCWSICDSKHNGDESAYSRYVNFLTTKYPIPADPYTEEQPVDFTMDQGKSLYENAFYLLYFLKRYAHVYGLIDSVLMKVDPNTITIGINEFFKYCLISILEFASHGYSLAIIPIMDENIIYRPKRLAQTETCKSFLYYDKYVEATSLIDSDQVETPSYSYKGGTIVSGHYRSGHYRNGHWVSGHWVSSHYRR